MTFYLFHLLRASAHAPYLYYASGKASAPSSPKASPGQTRIDYTPEAANRAHLLEILAVGKSSSPSPAERTVLKDSRYKYFK